MTKYMGTTEERYDLAETIAGRLGLQVEAVVKLLKSLDNSAITAEREFFNRFVKPSGHCDGKKVVEAILALPR